MVRYTATASMADFPSPAIANEFVALNGGALPQMKLHKLSYIAHGWNLVINNEALIAEQPQAWANGPVYRRIWNRIRDYGLDAQGMVLRSDHTPFRSRLSEDERIVINHVWRKYRKYDQYKLSDMTHQPGTPWTQTYFGSGQNAPIPNDIIERHYREIALAGRINAA